MKEERKSEEKEVTLSNIRTQLRDIALGIIDRMNERGCYQSYWMHKHRIPPVPVWLVDWFVTPIERYRARRRHDDDEIPF